MKKTKVFIDGSVGTTGLRIFERFSVRDDIELLQISEELRKDPEEIKKFINASDVTFLCLPDAAAREAVALCDNENVKIIDTSTAHRTAEGWAYGYPELSPAHRDAIKNGNRIAVPGCHATGFITLVYPLIANGIMPEDYPVSAFSLTGYSGGGKGMIAEYEGEERDKELDSPRAYGVTQMHKHLPEMQAITGLKNKPLFTPIVADYYSGMLVSIGLYTDLLKAKVTPEEVHAMFEKHYAGEKFVKVMPFGAEAETRNFLGSNNCSGWDGIEIFVTGNEERIMVSSRFDNLGKGASGAAIQCLNVILGCDEAKGLNV
ncbi:MAG: N-acetyl-gamma-glutamyl-phosphate reductase [Lachnospiraceae bacterium]|nr:N-acetyl-gamma-glutamyl-phosphate reductase [Lachnospiraceae bacterium]